MSAPIFSASWYRVSGLKPRLRSHAHIHRHRYRGEIWYVLQELTTERFFRFSPAVYAVVGLMDGTRTVDDLWEEACSRLGDDAPTQDEMIQVLSQLYRADVLQCDVPPDAAELLTRRQEQTRRVWQSRIFSLFSWRFPILDPERGLEFFRPVVAPLFGPFGAILWLAVVGPAAILLAAHWTELTEGVLDRVFMPGNLALLWLLFPAIKIVHEFGHAFATKVYGGEVHDMGIMLLVITPVPYVDASSASAFQRKWQRVVVGAAGMLVELFVASLALFLWINAEPGLVRTLAFNTVFIASASTIVFNANPLLRFDGYYILSDLLEIPNLRGRANAYLLHLFERYLLGNRLADTPETSGAERAWFVAFATLAFVYRTAVVTAILLFVASRFFTVGILLAGVAAVMWFGVPLVKGASFLATSPRLRPVRGRAIAVTVSILAIAGAAIGFVPVPYRTGTEGVVWIPDESFVRTDAEGFVETIAAEPGGHVEEGTLLFTLSNPLLRAEEDVWASYVRELEARYVGYLPTDPIRADTTRDELQRARDRWDRIREDIEALSIRSRGAGTFVVPVPEDLPGRFARKGETLGYVLEPDRMIVRAVVAQDAIDRVRTGTYGVDVRLSERLAESLPASIVRVVPGASDQLPAKALGTAGGGRIPTNPGDPQGMTAMQQVFQIDVEVPSRAGLFNLGGRAYVRFDHGRAPLGVQWYVEIRQLFLSRFDI